MPYQVIARKWRPQTFDEVTGQEPITRTLRNAIEHERLHHAYLFSGARGVGKTTTARLLAKALNCHKFDKPTVTPCAISDPTACASCREIAEGRSIDVQEIDAASHTQVDNVREVILGTIGIAPARDRYKIFIIDEVHMLSQHSFNALLKTLEEPPARVVFIMATTELHKLPDTILSRCQQFEFRTIATAKIAERLRLIADAEKISVPEDALREIARAGDGSMRDAQSALDQVISFSSGTAAAITVQDVEAALGIAGTETLARVVRSIGESRPNDALAAVDELVMRGHDLRNFCRELLAHLRDLLVAKVSGETGALVESSAFDKRELARQAAEFSESDLVRFFHSLTETETNLRNAAHPRYQLEVGLLKLIEMRRLAPLNQILERLMTLEEALRTSSSNAAAVNKTPPAAAGGSSAPNSGASGSKKTSTPISSGRSASSPPQPPHSNAINTPVDEAAPVKSSPAASDTSRGAASNEFASAFAETPPQAFSSESNDASFLTPPVLTLVPPPGAQGGNATGTAAAAARSAFNAPTPPDRAAGPAATNVNASGGTSGSAIERIKAALEKRHRMFLVIALEGARVANVEGDELCVEFAPEAKHLRDNLAKPESVKLLREVCREVLGRDTGVRISVREQHSAERGAQAQRDDGEPPTKQEDERLEKQRLREIAEQHPAVQHLLRTFRGEIIDVRRTDGEQ